jgi:hypothetical protein
VPFFIPTSFRTSPEAYHRSTAPSMHGSKPSRRPPATVDLGRAHSAVWSLGEPFLLGVKSILEPPTFFSFYFFITIVQRHWNERVCLAPPTAITQSRGTWPAIWLFALSPASANCSKTDPHPSSALSICCVGAARPRLRRRGVEVQPAGRCLVRRTAGSSSCRRPSNWKAAPIGLGAQ